MAKLGILLAATVVSLSLLLYWVGLTSPRTTSPTAITQVLEVPTESAAATALTPSKRRFDFGVLPKGGQAQETFWLHNPSKDPVEIDRIDTSCDCFVVILAAKTVPPNDKILATIKLDFSHDNNFFGSLGMQATAAINSGNGVAFEVHVDVIVKDVAQ